MSLLSPLAGKTVAEVEHPELDVRLETGLPAALSPGTRTVIFIAGSCFHRRERIRGLEVLVGETPYRPIASGMPRLDLYRSIGGESANGSGGPGEDPKGHSYRSGFWASVPVEAPLDGSVRLAVRARLADGSSVSARLGEIPVRAGGATPGAPRARVVIAMATYSPSLELLKRQVESIRSQTFGEWGCIVSDDCTPPAEFERMLEVFGGDPRFVVDRGDERLGFYRNFERALGLVPEEAEFVALADQDDRWHPEKLEVLVREIGSAQLVYSDQRLVDPGGRVISDTYWTGRRNNHSNLASLLIANTVTGAASLMRRELLEVALPFPHPPGPQYHDHWLALSALATGGIAYVDRPLYDYVQHEGGALGHAAANPSPDTRGRLRVLAARLRRGEWTRMAAGWRAAYFFAYSRLRLLAEVLLWREPDRITPHSRRVLRRFARAESSLLGVAWLLSRRARELFGRTETLGAEGLLVRGILWRYVMRAASRVRRRPIPKVPYDASLPAAQDAEPNIGLEPGVARNMAKLIEPLTFSVSTSAPERVNVLIPTVELKHFFGGYITKFNLARKLAESGLRVRVLTVDPTPPLPRDWRRRVESYAGLAGVFESVEVEFARDHDAPVQVNPADAFVATTWWTAHLAHSALEPLQRSRFLYLIQEYEPYTHPMGSWAALAMGTYALPHTALFSTDMLRDFFAARGYGVFAAGHDEGLRDSASFRNAITAAEAPTVEELQRRDKRRLLFYARPEAHGARNMFELGLLGLSQAISRGVFSEGGWEFAGIGAVDGGDRIRLGPSASLEILPRTGQREYARLLPAHDVGLALMCTPHPSLVPIEMASAGQLAVTNSFETKTPERMAAISDNLITVSPTPAGIVAGLSEAVAGVGDFERRVRGSEVDWSRDWDEAFAPDVIGRVRELLAAT